MMTTPQWLSVLLLGLALAVPGHATTKPAAKTTRAPAKAVARTTEQQPLSPEQLAIADKVHVGHIPCELSTHVTLTRHPHVAGRFVLEIGRQRYAMEPVVTSTGAVRLEDMAAGAVWLQLANKSMLMNQKLGKRIADECMSADQQLVAQALMRSPAPSLLEAPKPAPQPGEAATATK